MDKTCLFSDGQMVFGGRPVWCGQTMTIQEIHEHFCMQIPPLIWENFIGYF